MDVVDDRPLLLVVEDEDDTRFSMCEYLRILGFDTVQAVDGGYGLAELARSEDEFDAVLLDLRMPILDGFTFLDAYRGPVPVVVLSAWSDTHKLPRQPAALVAKPVDMSEIVGMLREMIDA